MRRKLSLLSMIAGHSLGKVFLILIAMAAANGVLFYTELADTYRDMRYMLDRTSFLWAFGIAFTLLSIVLCSALCDRGGKQNYFLNRLSVSPRVFYLTHVLYNTLCYVLLFAAEALSLLGLCFWMQSRFPESFNQQTLMLACYQSSMLHTFLPLSDVLGWVVLGCLLLGLGICTAALPAMNRRGRRSISTFLMCATVPFYVFLQNEFGAVELDAKIIALVGTAFFAFTALWGPLDQEVTENG